MKRIIALFVGIVMLLVTSTPLMVYAASNIKINGVDIGYAAKQYFSKTGKECKCHNRDTCGSASDCTCKGVSSAWQCKGFALHCQNKLFGYNEKTQSEKFKNVGSIGKGSLTVDNLKKLISSAPIGSHIRTYSSEHSMILLEKTNTGFTVVQANGSNNEEYSGHYNCRIGTAKYTWSEYVASGYGKRGIQYVKIPKDYKDIPSTPKISSVSADDSNVITIKWSSVSGADEYIVEGRKAGGTYETLGKTSKTSYTYNGTEGGSLYWFKVKAKNTSGTSEGSSASGCYTKPKAPSTEMISTSSIRINWSSSGGATSYELLARKCGDEGYTTIAENIEGYSYTHTGLEAGTQYYYKIKAHNKEHPSIVSARSVEGYGFTRLKVPVVMSKNATQIELDWERGSLNGDYTYSYRVKRKLSGTASFANIATVSASSYVDSGLLPATTYDYYIEVWRNDGACVTYSDMLSATTSQQQAESITVSPNTLTMAEGTTYNLSAVISPSNTNNKSIKWHSSNTDIAAVSNGTVTAKAAGVATITAETANGKRANCTVTVDTAHNLCSHSYGAWETSVKASCENGGEQYRICTKCGKTETVAVPPSGHSYSDEWTVVKEPTCYEYGIKKKLCTSCGVADESSAEELDMYEHTAAEEWITVKEPTCTEVGIRHNVCTVCQNECNVEEIPVTPHIFEEEWITERESTCQEEGIEYRVCQTCGDKEYHYKEKSEHDYELTDFKDATETEEGYATYKCNVCNDTYTDTLPIIKDNTEIKVADVKAKPGDEIEVTIELAKNTGFANLSVEIGYDSDVMALTQVTSNSGVGANFTPAQSYSSNPFNMSWDSASNVTYNGNLATLTFKLNENTPDGIYSITIDYYKGINDNYTDGDNVNYDENFVAILITYLDGIVTVSSRIPGDVNRDEIVDSKDATYLLRHLAGWNIPDIDTSALDIDGNEIIDNKDATVLLRYLAGWEVTLN